MAKSTAELTGIPAIQGFYSAEPLILDANMVAAGVTPDHLVLANFPPRAVSRALEQVIHEDPTDRLELARLELADQQDRFDRRADEGRVRPKDHQRLQDAQTAVAALAQTVAWSQEARERAGRLRAAQYDIGRRGSAARPFAIGAAIGIAITSGLFGFLKYAGGDISNDPSILPGNKPAIVPGVQDINGYHYTYDQVTPGTVEVKVSAAESNHGLAANPFAPNFDLQGNELDIDKNVVKGALTIVKGPDGKPVNVKISQAQVRGLSSDETDEAGANLGKPDTRDAASGNNQTLADKRAQVGERALRDEANALGIAIPDGAIQTSGQEVLLTKLQIKDVTSMAARLGMTTQQFIEAYDNGKLVVGPATKKTLDQYFADNRGVQYDITLTYDNVTTKDTTSVKKYVEQMPAIWGEAVAVFMGLMVGNMTAGTRFKRNMAVAAHKRAAKFVERARNGQQVAIPGRSKIIERR